MKFFKLSNEKHFAIIKKLLLKALQIAAKNNQFNIIISICIVKQLLKSCINKCEKRDYIFNCIIIN